MAAFNTIIIVFRIINDYYGNKILLSNLFQFLKNKNINLNKLNKYKSSKEIKEINISKNDLIPKIPINNYGVDPKGKFIFTVQKSSCKNIKPEKSGIFRDRQKIYCYRHTNKDYLRFCICPYFLIKKNQQLYDIKDEICSIFSVENILDAIKSLVSLHTLKTEFYDRVIESKININNYTKIRELNDYESKSKMEMLKLSESMNDK